MNCQEVRDYITGGHGTFTIRSKVSGTRFTYTIRTNDERYPYFVSLLTGADNESSYTFTGTIFDNAGILAYRPSFKSSVGKNAQSNMALQWFVGAINSGNLPDNVEFFHEGRCGRCGRKLTTPESIERGMGPHCANKE